MKLFPLTISTSSYGASKSDQKEQVSFSIVEGKTKVAIDLNKPEIIYLQDKDSKEKREELISQISIFILLGKTIEINCGKINPQTEYVMDELLTKEFINLIERQDDQKIEAKQEQRVLKDLSGWLFHIKKNYGFIIYENKDQRPKIIDLGKLPKYSDYVFQRQQDNYDFSNIGDSKYSTAPSLITTKPVYFYLDVLNKMLEENLIVQIQRVKASGKAEELGMFVEKDPNTEEIIFNLNGQNEFHFLELFIPLVLYYLEQNHPVLVECDVDLRLEDIAKIEERISQGDTYNQIYKGILMKTKAEIYVDRRVANPDIHEEHNFIVMKPKKYQEK